MSWYRWWRCRIIAWWRQDLCQNCKQLLRATACADDIPVHFWTESRFCNGSPIGFPHGTVAKWPKDSNGEGRSPLRPA